MTADLAALMDWATVQFWTGFVVFLRVGAMVALLPAFGEQAVPARVRVAAALALTFVTAPALAPAIGPPPAAMSAMAAILMAEVVTGLLFGLLLRLMVMALSTAGALIAQGLSLAQMFGAGPAAEPMPVFSHLLVGAGLALAAVLGLHMQAVGYVLGSYDAIPFAMGTSGGAALDTAARAIAASFGTAISLAAPFLIAALVYNLAIGAINRAMPQLMVTFIGAPALTAGGLALLVIAVPVALSHWADLFAGQIAEVRTPQ
jgi:flagellar biosynthetic protein FliR